MVLLFLFHFIFEKSDGLFSGLIKIVRSILPGRPRKRTNIVPERLSQYTLEITGRELTVAFGKIAARLRAAQLRQPRQFVRT
jgi:hypothetical protein